MKVLEKVKALGVAVVLAIAGVGAAAVNTGEVYADGCTYNETTNDCDCAPGASEAERGACVAGHGLQNNKTLEQIVNEIVNMILYIVGILAVVMVIVGGIQYTLSAGDQAKVTKAKNMIVYGIVGLVIAILAYAIVNFVISKI